jgi:hypothetical protein
MCNENTSLCETCDTADNNRACSSGYYCKDDLTCGVKECEIEDIYSCEGLQNYCDENNTCQIRDCFTEDCPKIASPLFDYEYDFITLNRESKFNLDINDHISDPTIDHELELSMSADLGLTSLFMELD